MARTPPRLTPDTVRSDHELWPAIERVIMGTPAFQRCRLLLLRRQKRLRALADDAAWSVALDLEALSNARYEMSLTHAVRWAFGEGLRCGRRRA
jgi:hypothetical protein